MSERENKMRILKMIKPLDWVICAIGVFVFIRVDFHNVTIEDVIYMTVILMWFLMLCVRLYIQSRRS